MGNERQQGRAPNKHSTGLSHPKAALHPLPATEMEKPAEPPGKNTPSVTTERRVTWRKVRQQQQQEEEGSMDGALRGLRRGCPARARCEQVWLYRSGRRRAHLHGHTHTPRGLPGGTASRGKSCSSHHRARGALEGLLSPPVRAQGGSARGSGNGPGGSALQSAWAGFGVAEQP